MTKKLSIDEHKLIKEMCYTNSDLKILVELNRIRANMDITEVVTITQVTGYRQRNGLNKTRGKHSIVIKKESK